MFRFSLAFLTLLLSTSVYSQLQNPDAFLGHVLGSYFTRHHQVVDYFNHLEENKPNNIKVEKYGKTNENRDLIVAYISSDENLKNIEAIKSAHSNLSSDEKVAIVWLSYNVHGNESAGTEAAMLSAYELLTSKKELLENVLVILDPCINPDGRDRYVNWYNTQVGTNANNNVMTAEHSEPWPGGRPNHYLFDLNRDWAWLTQTESKQRIALYNQWLPHVHVDFHEQGINEPYYFAPAAEPYHEVITQWQRAFQTFIGLNNASYFDKNGWFYFTKEIFDLLYPSYGDTYPMYNGAVGMTYEQGGSGRGGLEVINETGSELTLKDRLLHHHTTGISTVEESGKRYLDLINQNHEFYNNQKFEYQSYVLFGEKDKIKLLSELLDAHEIAYSFGSSGNAKGFQYSLNDKGSHQIENGDLIISTNQKKGTLVNVLFEPKTKLSDSLTYDITAWSLPYAYGLDAIASDKEIEGNETEQFVVMNAVDNNAYAYLANWNSMEDARFLSALLQNGIKVRFAENAFELNGKSYPSGTLIIAKGDNETDYASKLIELAYEHQIQLFSTATGMVSRGNDFGSSTVKLIGKTNVLMFTGDASSSLNSGEIWHYFDNELDFPVSRINVGDFSTEILANFQVIMLPEGDYAMQFDYEELSALQNWVNSGGKVIAFGSALSSLSELFQSSILLANGQSEEKETSSENHEHPNIPYSKQEREAISSAVTGAIIRCKVDTTNPLSFGYSDEYFTLRLSADSYGWIAGAQNVVYTEENPEVISGFVGADAKKTLDKNLVFGVENMGNGCIVHFADNPLFRGFWENGKLVVANALFMVGR